MADSFFDDYLTRRQANQTNQPEPQIDLNYSLDPRLNKVGPAYEEVMKAAEAKRAILQSAGIRREKERRIEEKTLGDQAKDVGISALKSAIAVPELAVGLVDIPAGGRVGEFLENQDGLIGFRPHEAKEALSEMHSDGYKAQQELFQDADGILEKTRIAITNPALVGNTVVESVAPMLAGGLAARGLMASTRLGAAGAAAVGEGTVMAGMAASDMRSQTKDGRLDPAQQAASVGIGALGGLFGFLGGKAAQKLGFADVDTMVAQGMGREAIAEAISELPTKSITKATIQGAISEGLLEELPQSMGETILSNLALDKPWNEGLEDAAVMGALAGAAMGGPVSGTQALGKKIEKAGATIAREQQEKATVEAAIASGDVSAFLDPQHRSYSPQKAIQALLGHSRLEGTSPEVREANLTQAGEIVAELEAKQEELEGALTFTTLDGINKAIADTQSRLEELDVNDPANQQNIADLQSNLEVYNQTKVELEETGEANPQRTAARQRELMRVQEWLKNSQEMLDVFSQDATSSIDIEADTQAASQPDPEVAQPAATRMVNLAMSNPNGITPEAAKALADNANSGLSTEQRSFFRKFAQARIEQNQAQTLSKVNDEILNGASATKNRPAQKGVNQYRKNIASALITNNRGRADRELAGLKRFRDSQVQKARMVRQANAEFQKTGNAIQVIHDGSNWVINRGEHLEGQERLENAPITIHKGTPSHLVPDIVAGAKAVDAGYTELDAAYRLKFPSTTGATNVENISQSTRPEDQSESSSNAVPATETEAGSRAVTDGVSEVPGAAETQTQATVESQEAPASAPTTVDAQNDVKAKDKPKAATKSTNEISEQTNGQSASTEEVPQAPETGELEVLKAEKATEPKSFKERNLIADYTTQQVKREGDKTQRPLVAVKDFLSKHISDALSFTGFQEFNERQQVALDLFADKAKGWQKRILKNLTKGDSLFRYKDPIQFLIQDNEGTLSLEENVTTAMAYAAWSWLVEAGNKTAFNTDEEINNILMRDEDHPVSQHERHALQSVGTRQNVVINALGQRVVQALGIRATKDAPHNLIPTLESSFGMHVMKMLMDEGLILRHTVTGSVMQELTGLIDTQEKAQFQFIQLVRDTEGNPISAVKEIFNTAKNTQGLLDKLFKVEASLLEPSLEPQTFDQQTTKNTNQRVPKFLADILNKKNAEANYVRQDSWQLLTQMDSALVDQMSGIEEITDQTHPVRRASMEASNAGIRRELDRFFDFVGETLQNTAEGLNTAIYFSHNVWKQQRVGISNNVINPQTSKVHRFLVFRKSWETKINLNNPEQMENFHLRVAEGLGVKTDKASNEKSLKEYQRKISPKIRAAIEAARKGMYDGNMTKTDQQALADGVAEGGENFHSLDAIIALAHMEQAIAEGKSEFTVQMMGEVDGVTNGPMLSHFLMGAANSVTDLFGLLNRGGFFEANNNDTQYNQWRERPGHTDLYETTALHLTQNVANLIIEEPKLKPILQSIYSFTGSLLKEDGSVAKEGRNIVKTPLTAMVFGSSITKATDSMANNFIDSIYEAIEEVNSNPTPELVRSIEYDLRTLGVQNAKLSELATREFTRQEINAIKSSFNRTLGKSVKKTMETDFYLFIEQRKQLVKATELAFELYNGALTGIRDAYIEELKSKGQIALDSKNNPIHDLTRAQYEELNKRFRKIVPVMHTQMSKESGSLAAGLMASKTGRQLSTRSVYQTETKFKTPFNDNKAHSSKGNSYEVVESSPGVALAPMSVHSLDSYISHLAASMGEVLNIHDAHGAGLSNFHDAARNLNQATWKALLNYSPMTEAFEMLSRTVVNLNQLSETEGLPPAAVANIQTAIQQFAFKHKVPAGEVISGILRETKAASVHADSMKLTALSQIAAIDQYALEGGNYIVTDQDRKEAQDRLAKIVENLSKEEETAIRAFESGLKVKEATAQVETDPELDGSLVDADVLQIPSGQARQLLEHTAQDNTLTKEIQAQVSKVLSRLALDGKGLKEAVLSSLKGLERVQMVQMLSQRYKALDQGFWGPQGESEHASDPTMVEFFENKPTTTAKEVMQMLHGRLSGRTGNVSEFQKKLLNALWKTVPDNTKVQYITPTASPELAPHGTVENAFAWFASGNNTIYVLSPEFLNSKVAPETVLHELIHAALYSAVENAKDNSDAAALVKELKSLHKKARKFAEDNNIAEKHAAALSNIHEFIAWGLSNVDFQAEVLNKVQYETKNQKNPFITGMQKFIDTIVGILFRNTKKSEQEVAKTGLSVFLADTSGLINYASQVNKQRMTSKINLAMSNPSALDIDKLTSLELFNALSQSSNSNVSPTFNEHLKGVLNNIVDKLHGPFGSFKEAAKALAPKDPVDMWLKALATGQPAFASKVQGAPFRVSDEELFVIEQVEATVRAALEDNESFSMIAYRELKRLYDEMEKKLSPQDFYEGSDWAGEPQHVRDEAQAQYDFLFKLEGDQSGRLIHLARFAALGLGHEKISNLLNRPTDKVATTPSGQSFVEKLQNFFNKVLEYFFTKSTGTVAGQPANEKLRTLVETLVDIEAKKIQRLQKQNADFIAPIENAVKNLSDKTRAKAIELADSEFIKNSRFEFVKLAGNAAKIIGVEGRADQFMVTLQRFRNEHFKGIQGVSAGLLGELKGQDALVQFLLRMAKNNERLRKKAIAAASKAVRAAFANGASNLTREEKGAVSAALLRTGAHHLMKQFSTKQIEELLADSTKREAEINNQLAKLSGYTAADQNFWKQQAKFLGHHLVVGGATNPMQLWNAYTIAKMDGWKISNLSESQVADVEAVIQNLIPLYSFQYLGNAQRQHALKVMRQENTRGKENGIEFLFKLHANMEQESLTNLFNGNKRLMKHGYMPEIVNPHHEVVSATKEEGKELLLKGYVEVADVENDPADPDQKGRQLYMLRDGGLNPYVSGAMSLSSLAARGSKKHNGLVNASVQQGIYNQQLMNQIAQSKQNLIRNFFAVGSDPDPTTIQNNFMIPILNEKGEIVNWRYTMKESTRDNLLERTNDFDTLMGAFAGSLFDKVGASKQNTLVVQALYDQFQEDYAKRPESYTLIGPNATDPAFREIWAMLPEESKKTVREIWKTEGMRVRTDQLDIIFGYRKLSAANMFKKADAERARHLLFSATPKSVMELRDIEYLERLAVGAFENAIYGTARLRGKSHEEAKIMSQRAGNLVAKGERAWQEIVSEVKDIIVIKSGVVLMGNILSNFSLLYFQGVPVKDMIHHHNVALKSTMAYQRDSSELAHLKLLVSTNHTLGNDDEITRRIAKLEDDIARNPVRELIDEGLMPTIVEDVAQEDDRYSYKSWLATKAQKITDRIPKPVREVGKHLYVAHDTSVYQVLSKTTQLSDFVARYTLYQHLTTRKNNPLSHKEAVQKASDAFVNYDIPMHRVMQYSDDMGFTMFSKYFLRIQKVLLDTARENPARVMLGVALNQVADLPLVLDSSMLTRIGNNPFEWGALQYPGSLDELWTTALTEGILQ